MKSGIIIFFSERSNCISAGDDNFTMFTRSFVKSQISSAVHKSKLYFDTY